MNYEGKTKIISYIAVLAIIFSMIPQYTAMAAATINLGDYVQMGTYDANGEGTAEPILWRCVAFEKIKGTDANGNPITDSTDTKTAYEDGYLPLMLADTSICEKEFDTAGSVTTGSHSRGSDRTSYGSNYWGDSNIRDWLNSSADTVTYTCGNSPSYSSEKGFLTNFNDTEKSAIKTVTQKSLLSEADKDISGAMGDKAHIYNSSISTAVQDYATAYSEQVTDTMFLLDVQQVKNVYDNDTSLGGDCYYKLFGGYYWLRSPYSSSLDYVRNIDSSGYVSYRGAHYGNRGVRPAFFLDTEKEFVSGEGTSADPYTLTETPLFEGDGTEESPYLISTLEQLETFRDNVNGGETYEGNYFKLANDIDLGGNAENQWTPIGVYSTGDHKKFAGSFDGGGFTVSGLYINSSKDAALFEWLDTQGTIKNLNVSGNVTGTSDNSYVCGICCTNLGTIESCSFTGSASSVGYLGGICASNFGMIRKCCNAAYISGTDTYIGGIAGSNSGTIENCYNTGAVKGSYRTGGICGNNTGGNAIVQNCYNVGQIPGTGSIGGVCGNNNATVSTSYYLTTSASAGNGSGTASGATAKTADDLNTQSTFLGWDFESIWKMSADHKRPILRDVSEPLPPLFEGMGTEQSPYLIPDLETLKAFRDSVNGGENYDGKFIKLTANIDLGGSRTNIWDPIGTQSARFKGSFDGGNHTVSALYVFSSDYYLGLFGRSETAIRNLTVEGTVISNGSSALAGGICGYNGGSVENCHSEVAITGAAYSGGIVGETRGNVKCCFNTAAVSGENVGGIAGSSYGAVSVDNCYNTGSVSGTEKAGGIIGNMTAGSLTNSYNYGDVTAAGTNAYAGGVAGEVISVASSGTVAKCYYLTDTAASGVGSSSSNQTAEVKTADEFKVQTGFDGWDFDTVWTMSTAHGRPILRAIPEPDPPHTHTLVHKDAVAATCTEDGTGEYWKCEGTNGCGKMFSDEDGTSEITSIPTISAAGHTWSGWEIAASPTLTATGTAKRVCTKNSEHEETKTIPALSDTTVWTLIDEKDPTETEDGYKKYTSTDYGEITVTIEKRTEPSKSPIPSTEPSAAPTVEPTSTPSANPTAVPTGSPTVTPITEPTDTPTAKPTTEPTGTPTAKPAAEPTSTPTAEPTSEPTPEPFEPDLSVTQKTTSITVKNTTSGYTYTLYDPNGNIVSVVTAENENDIVFSGLKKNTAYKIIVTSADGQEYSETVKTKSGSSGASSSVKATPVAAPTVTPTAEPASSPADEPTAQPSVTSEPTDTDEPSDISKVQHKAYIVGYEGGTFMPDGNITRAETAAILARLTEGFDENGSYTTSFADVDNNSWYYRYIGFEESQNIITGYEDGDFKPENNITRAEFANMIVRFAELNTENADTSFTDINGHWAKNQIAVCFAAGYIKGYADNTFMPDNYITRAEAAAIINRVLVRDDIKDFENPFSDVKETHWAYADIMEAAVTHNVKNN